MGVAASQSNIVLKDNEEGGDSANTQTGSVSVADSQSNIVVKDNEEGGDSFNKQTGSVSVADSQSNIVQSDVSRKTVCSVGTDASVAELNKIDNDCEPDARIVTRDARVNVQCVETECVKKSVCVQTTRRDGDNQASSSTEKPPSILVAGRKIRTKFKLSKLEGGKFSLKLNSTEKKEGPEKEGNMKCNSDRLPTLKSFRNCEDKVHARDEIRGENVLINSIPVIRTPKRKSDNFNSVSNLISKYSDGTTNLPRIESPAKRRRLWGQGGQGGQI